MVATYEADGLKPSANTNLQNSTFTGYQYNLTDFVETTLNFRVNWKPATNRSSMFIRFYTDFPATNRFECRHNSTSFYFTNTDAGSNSQTNDYVYVNNFFGSKASSIPHHTLDLTLQNYSRGGKLFPAFHFRSDFIYSNQDDSNKISITQFDSGDLYSPTSSHNIKAIAFFLNNSATFAEFDLRSYVDGGLLHG